MSAKMDKMDKMIRKKVQFEPRDYQLYYLEKAKEQNVIICLGTGSGKTFITIMLLKEYGVQIKQERMKAIFLGPTNPLVVQQAAEIRKHTLYDVREFYGDLGVDNWNEAKWRQEIDANDVLVMTPDIFYAILSKQIIDIQTICVLIFDEAHHGGMKKKNNGLTDTNHAYKKIMNFIIEKEMHNRIRIIGCTASVVNACYDPLYLTDCFKAMELTYNARILGEFDFDPRFLAEPEIMIWLYKEHLTVNETYHQLFLIHGQINQLIRIEEKQMKDDYIRNMLNINGYLMEKQPFKPSYIQRMIRDLLDVQNELGVYPAYIVCLEFKKEFERIKLNISDEHTRYMVILGIRFLDFIHSLYSKVINKLQINVENFALLNLASCKLLRLLDIIQCYHDSTSQLSALIFVDRVLFSFAISKFLELLSDSERFSYMKPSFFVGNNNEYLNFKFIKESVKNFRTTIQDFKEGKFNLLVTTAVLEEGIDIGTCNLVIRFSEAKNYREFVQSKGRARSKDSYFIMMHNEVSRLDNQIKIFLKTEEFLNHRFKLSKEANFKESVLPNDYRLSDDYLLANEEEFIQSSSGAVMQIHEAGPFLQRYIIKKGNKNYSPVYNIDELETGFKVRLNLIGVTPLKQEVEGKVYRDQVDAFKSACLQACKELYEIGQLSDKFIPISEEQVVRRRGLNREYTDEEKKELDLIFGQNHKQRLMFEKQISSFSYFKTFCKPTGYDLYELVFVSEDKYLQEGNERLALITELNLVEQCLSTIVYSSLYQATIQLNLIEKDISLTSDELERIGEFTVSIFKTAIPCFKKRADLKFNLERCLFKFVLIDANRSIDYGQMNAIVNLDQGHIREQLLSGENNLVRATHTNLDYKLINLTSSVYPKDEFFYEPQNKFITYNEYFKQRYDKVIVNQRDAMIQVEKADLISCYSIFVEPEKKEIEEDKTSRFNVYLPKEFCVISTVTKSLHKKLSTLSPLIFRIKQKLILRHMCYSLNLEVLNVNEDEQFEKSLFDSQRTYYDNIDEYISEIFRKKLTVPFFESSDSSSSDEESQEDSDDTELAAREFAKLANKLVKKKKETKSIKRIKEQDMVIHPAIQQGALDTLLYDSMEVTLRENGFSSVEKYVSQYVNLFENLIKTDSNVGPKNFTDIEPKLKKRKMDESAELQRMDFNFWVNEQTSNKFLICPTTLLTALTTKSAIDAVNLERLEYIGDSFLKLVTCCVLFHTYQDASVGELDILKNQMVSNKNLYRISKGKHLLEYVFADNFLPGISFLPDGFDYTDVDPNDSERLVTVVDSEGFKQTKLNLVDKNHYQELKPKAISDVIEGLIGGVLTSTGMRNACLFMKYLSIYSDQFELTLDCDQKNWFKKYDPLACDPLGRIAAFTRQMYDKHDFANLELKIGYTFKNKALLIQAFKHVSYTQFKDMPSYEELEFLGDAVIDYLVAKYFYDDEEANFTPGQLSNLKQSCTNNHFFGTLSVKYELDLYLIYNSPALFDSFGSYKSYFQATYLSDDQLIIPHSYLIIDEPASINFDDGIEINKVLGDIFESLMGAIFIDSEFCLNTVWSVLHKFMLNELIAFKKNPPKTFLAQMHELYPREHFSNGRTVGNRALVDITVNGELFTGSGDTKKLAKMDAAKQVIKYHLEDAAKRLSQATNAPQAKL